MIKSNKICFFFSALGTNVSIKNRMPSGLGRKKCFFYYDQYCNDLNSIMAMENMLHASQF